MPFSHVPMTSSNGPLAHPDHERASTVGPRYHQQNGLSFASRVIARPRTSTVDVPFGMRIRDTDGVFNFGDQSTGSAPRWPTNSSAFAPVVRTDVAACAAQSMITPSPTERSMHGRESSLLSAASPSTSPSLTSPLDIIVRSASVQSDSASTAGMDSTKSSLSSLLKAGANGQFVLGREGYYGTDELKALFSQWKTELKEETASSTSSSAIEKTSDRGKARAVSAGESSKDLAGTSQGRFKGGQFKRTRTETVRVSKLEKTQGEVEQSTEDDEDEDEDEDGYGEEDEDEDEDYGMAGVHRGSAKRRASSSSSSSSMADRKRMKVSESSLVVSRGKRGKDKAVVKNHKCDHCEKRFSRPSQLKQHIYKHTGEKPFACEICSRHFSVSSNLKRHIRTHTTNLHRQNVNRTGDCDFNPLIIDTGASSSSSASSSAFNPSRKVILHMYLPEGTSESSTRLVLEGFAAAVQQPSLPASFGGAVVEVHPRSTASLQNNNNGSIGSNTNNNNSASSVSSTSSVTNAINNNSTIDSSKKDDSNNNVVHPSSSLLPPKNEDADGCQA
ncbi:hypothetical protein BGZ68_006160 [Mortierella alpina]|nr:hypothetical protein BGZ68_006160 [Mortierella alpina]